MIACHDIHMLLSDLFNRPFLYSGSKGLISSMAVLPYRCAKLYNMLDAPQFLQPSLIPHTEQLIPVSHHRNHGDTFNCSYNGMIPATQLNTEPIQRIYKPQLHCCTATDDTIHSVVNSLTLTYNCTRYTG